MRSREEGVGGYCAVVGTSGRRQGCRRCSVLWSRGPVKLNAMAAPEDN